MWRGSRHEGGVGGGVGADAGDSADEAEVFVVEGGGDAGDEDKADGQGGLRDGDGLGWTASGHDEVVDRGNSTVGYGDAGKVVVDGRWMGLEDGRLEAGEVGDSGVITEEGEESLERFGEGISSEVELNVSWLEKV